MRLTENQNYHRNPYRHAKHSYRWNLKRLKEVYRQNGLRPFDDLEKLSARSLSGVRASSPQQ